MLIFSLFKKNRKKNKAIIITPIKKFNIIPEKGREKAIL
jgi:hypothetical protein